ncbi:MAG: HAD family phosphatase [Candidatus Woesearchaeota archaeon]
MRAIIFDLDGVLADTNEIHGIVEAQLLAEHGIHTTVEEITNSYAGIPTGTWFRQLIPDKSVDIEALMVRKRRMFREAVVNAKAMPGAKELLQFTKQNRFRVAIGTGSKKDEAMATLKAIGIDKDFEVIITADDIVNGKPDPLIFLVAAKRLGVKPEECTVIEDGLAGMMAAKTAGMFCIGLVSKPSNMFPADVQVSKLSDITNDMLQGNKPKPF